MIVNVVMSSGREYSFNSKVSDIEDTHKWMSITNKTTGSEIILYKKHIESINYREETETDKISWGTSD